MPLYAAVAPVVPPAPAAEQQAAAAAAAAVAAAEATDYCSGEATEAGMALPAQQQGVSLQQQHTQAQQAQQQQQQQQQQESAASSSHAVAASSAAEPAVQEDVTAERVCMLLLMAPRDVWQVRLRAGGGTRAGAAGLVAAPGTG